MLAPPYVILALPFYMTRMAFTVFELLFPSSLLMPLRTSYDEPNAILRYV